eukprot:scaffold933_cov190-Alexandrium_tamarense.AAC.13
MHVRPVVQSTLSSGREQREGTTLTLTPRVISSAGSFSPMVDWCVVARISSSLCCERCHRRSTQLHVVSKSRADQGSQYASN